MASLTGSTPAATYKSLLKIEGTNQEADGTLRIVEDGDGNNTALSLATDSVLVRGDGTRLYFHDADGGEYISGDGSKLTLTSGTDFYLNGTYADGSSVGLTTVLVANSNATTNSISQIYLAPANNVAGSAITCKATEDFSASGNRTADLYFNTRKDGTWTTSQLYLLAGGNIGINTTAPTYNFEVKGGDTSNDASTGGGQIALVGSDTSLADGDDIGTINFIGADTTLTSNKAVGAKILAEAAGNWDSTSDNDAPTELQFWTTNDGASDAIAQRMVIDKDGSVGIGLAPTANMVGLSIEAGCITLKERATPTADTNYGKIYTKTDNKLYFQDGAGTEHEISFA